MFSLKTYMMTPRDQSGDHEPYDSDIGRALTDIQTFCCHFLIHSAQRWILHHGESRKQSEAGRKWGTSRPGSPVRPVKSRLPTKGCNEFCILYFLLILGFMILFLLGPHAVIFFWGKNKNGTPSSPRKYLLNCAIIILFGTNCWTLTCCQQMLLNADQWLNEFRRDGNFQGQGKKCGTWRI